MIKDDLLSRYLSGSLVSDPYYRNPRGGGVAGVGGGYPASYPQGHPNSAGYYPFNRSMGGYPAPAPTGGPVGVGDIYGGRPKGVHNSAGYYPMASPSSGGYPSPFSSPNPVMGGGIGQAPMPEFKPAAQSMVPQQPYAMPRYSIYDMLNGGGSRYGGRINRY